MSTLSEQLEEIYPAVKPQRQRRQKTAEDVLRLSQHQSLAPTSTAAPMRPPRNNKNVTIRNAGGYFEVSICTRDGVCRGLSHELSEATTRARLLDNGLRNSY